MLKKIRSLADQHAIPTALIVFVLFDLLILSLGRILSLLPETLPMEYLTEIILMLVPAAFVFLFGFSHTFKKRGFFRGLLGFLPFILFEAISLALFFSQNLGNPETVWNSWPHIVLGVFSIFGVGVREECFYRATIQNIIAKKHANSVKGIWLTVIVSAIPFGLTHVTNLFFGMDPLAVLIQVIGAFFIGLLFGAAYLRSGNIWAPILIHTLTDVSALARSTFLVNITEIEVANQISFSVHSLIFWLVLLGITIFLLRPSKCKQICENRCFAGEESEEALRT